MKNGENEFRPKKILAVAHTVMDAGGDIFAFGRFPKRQLKDAFKEARRRWGLAYRFDDAIRAHLGTWRVWRNGIRQGTSPPEFTKFLDSILDSAGTAQEAESSWLDAVRLWPDPVCQENAFDRLWTLDENAGAEIGAMDGSVFEARLELAQLQGQLRYAGLSKEAARKFHDEIVEQNKPQRRCDEVARLFRDKITECADHPGWPTNFQMPRRISKAQRRLIERKLKDPKLLERARIGGFRYLDPDLWRRHVTEQNEAGLYPNQMRERLGKIAPVTRGRSLGYDAFAVGILYQECYRYRKEFCATWKKKEGHLPKACLSPREWACKKASEALNAIGYPFAPSPETIRVLVKSQEYLRHVVDIKILDGLDEDDPPDIP
jgi:hypothetical protein